MWKCNCGKLNNLKFRQIVCPLCLTECLIKQPSHFVRCQEMAKNLYLQLQTNYGEVNKLKLLAHHFWLQSQL